METDAVHLMERGWNARRVGDYQVAYRDMLAAIAMFRKAGDHTNLVTALGRLGHIEMDQHCYDEAQSRYEEAIGICRETGDTLGLAHKTRHLGDVHRHLDRQDEARACYAEALSLYRSHSDPPKLDLANAIRAVALATEDAGETEKAVLLWREARDLYQTLGLKEGVDECAARLDQMKR